MLRMYLHRSIILALVPVLVLVFVSLAPAQETGTDAAMPSSLSRREIPEGTYIPVPYEARETSPAYHSSMPGFFTTQVNVDAVGYNILGDAANEPSIAIDPTDSTKMVIGWRQFDTINSSFRQAGYGYTTDSGQTWTFPGVIEPGIFRSDPVLDSDSQGTFYFNSLSYDNDGFFCHVFRSNDGGATWDSGTYAHGGDKLWMVIDRTAGIGDGNIYAYWTSGYSSCLPGFFTRSVDGGASYEDCITIPDDPFWGTLAVGPDGELYVGAAGGDDFVVVKSTNAQDPVQSVVWDFSTSVDLDGYIGAFGGGPNPDGLLGQVWIAVDRSENWTHGNVYLLCSVVRSSTPDVLDVMFSRSTDGGQSWSMPVRVNDDTDDSAYQWFGTMSVAPTGRIDCIWLDTRDDPGGYNSSLYYASSMDAGATWSRNQRLTDSFDPHVGWPQQNKMGDYFDMISDSTGAHLAWAATFNGEQDVYYAHITPVIYVPDDYATIQEAIDATVDGNTIIVKPGTYHEHDLDFLGKAITVMSIDPQDSMVVASTIVDADSLGRGFHFHSEEDSTSVLTGLTITEGFVSLGGGGGILCENSSSPTISRCVTIGNYAQRGGGGIGCETTSSPLISNCMIVGNGALNFGGGILCDLSSPMITGSTIKENIASAGGGIAILTSESSLVIQNNLIQENSTENQGGGIYTLSSSGVISNNLIQGNSAGSDGGGIHCSGNSSITGNTITNNTASFDGGGIHCGIDASTVIANNTVTENTAEIGGGISCSSTSAPMVINTILWGNDASTGPEIYLGNTSTLTISYSDAEGGEDSVFVEEGGILDWGSGMLDTDPLFRDVGGEDFHLMAVACGDGSDSPCIDAGDSTLLDLVLDCSRGLGEKRSDMGAFGGGEEAPSAIDDGGEFPDAGMLPRAFALSQNYPNPFNPSTTISFYVPGVRGTAQQVNLTIYDLRGRRVKTLVDEGFEPGSYRVEWSGQDEQGRNVGSGIYLYTLKAGNNIHTRKMAVIK